MTLTQKQLKVVFFPVHQASAKLECLIRTAESHLDKGHKLIFLTSDAKGAEYIDKLLWSFRPEVFIPHSTDPDTSDLIYVTHTLHNPIQSHALFNLTPEPLSGPLAPITTLYELDDKMTPEKAKLGEHKYHRYKEMGHHLIYHGD